MSEELKPCPFCGSTLLGMSQTGIYWGRCDSCHGEGPTEDTEAEAIAAWNRRARPEPAASADADYPCRSDGRCQYAIDHGAEGMGHCPRGKCAMADATPSVAPEPVAWRYQDARGHYRYRAYKPGFDVEYAILKPVPLYAAHPPREASVAPEPREQQTQKSINLLRSALLRIEQAQSIHTAHALAESALRKWRSQNGEGHENCDV